MKIKADLVTDRTFELQSTQEGGVEVSWYDQGAGRPDDPLYVEGTERAAGYLTVLEDGRVCVPFERDGDYWVCVISKNDVSMAKTEDYPPLAESLVSVFGDQESL